MVNGKWTAFIWCFSTFPTFTVHSPIHSCPGMSIGSNSGCNVLLKLQAHIPWGVSHHLPPNYNMKACLFRSDRLKSRGLLANTLQQFTDLPPNQSWFVPHKPPPPPPEAISSFFNFLIYFIFFLWNVNPSYSNEPLISLCSEASEQ